MLDKSKRLPRKLFTELLEKSRYAQTDNFTLRFRLIDGCDKRFGVSVSKKVSKSAVDRNTVRRRVYASIYPNLSLFPNGLFLVVAKPGSKKLRGEALNKELKTLVEAVKSSK